MTSECHFLIFEAGNFSSMQSKQLSLFHTTKLGCKTTGLWILRFASYDDCARFCEKDKDRKAVEFVHLHFPDI